MAVHLRVQGNIKGRRDLKDNDIVGLAKKSKRTDSEGKSEKGLELIKLSLDPNKIANTSHRILAFQGGELRIAIGRNGIRSFTSALTTGHNGEAEIVSANFTPDEFGICNCWIPKSVFNLKTLTQMLSTNSSNIIIEDRSLEEAILEEAKKIAATRKGAETKLQNQAVATIEKRFAGLIKKLKEDYAEGYKDVKEYTETILPEIETELRNLRKS